MDTTSIVLLILGAIALYLISRWSPGPYEIPIKRETIENAIIEKCPYCNGFIGISGKDSVAWRMSKKIEGKDVCPHCDKRIKR